MLLMNLMQLLVVILMDIIYLTDNNIYSSIKQEWKTKLKNYTPAKIAQIFKDMNKKKTKLMLLVQIFLKKLLLQKHLLNKQ